MRNLAIPCAMVLMPTLMLAGCGGVAQKAEAPVSLVSARPVAPADFADTVDAVGTALANEQVVLAAPVTQRITALHFTDGGYVRQGQVIAVLAQGQEEAQLAAAQARARAASQQLERIQQLKQRGFATNANLDLQVAEANAAIAAAAQARASIADRVVRAPFAGYLGLRTISPGAVVTAGTPIATVNDISRIKLDFTVPETLLASLREGQSIVAEAAAFPGKVFNGTIATIDPAIDPATRAVRVRAILPNGDRTLKPGMLLTVRILSRQRQGLAVPELSVVGDGENRFVYRVEGAGAGRKAVRVAVKTGARQNGMVEITSGLKVGESIVTDGVVKLSDGVPIRLSDSPATPAAASETAPVPAG